MDNQPNDNIEAIQAANKEMLDYFNDAFLKQLEEIQEVKTQAFEIDIKIDELEKTKDLYAFKTNSKKSVFTPIISDGMDNERGKIIEEQISNLSEAKLSLNIKLRSLENSLNNLKKKLSLLNDAETAIKNIEELYASSAYNDEDNLDGFEFIEEDTSNNYSFNSYDVLMQDAFEKAFLTTMIDKNIKEGIIGINNKLDMISYLLGTDVSRARLTLQEIIANSKQVLESIDDIENRMDYNIDSTKPVWTQLDDYILDLKNQHPEYVIDSSVDCVDYEINLHPVLSINVIKLVNIFIDNIFKHAEAKQIEINASITPDNIEVYIHDDGVGIGADYLTQSPWYSSLHKAHQIIHLLNGRLDIKGDVISGTSVRFSFPVQN